MSPFPCPIHGVDPAGAWEEDRVRESGPRPFADLRPGLLPEFREL
jgi:hypothetical protein